MEYKGNNYNKKVGPFAFASIFCMLMYINLLLLSFIVKAKIFTFCLSQVFLLVTIWLFFLVYLTSRDYKLKYYFLGKNKQKIQEYCKLMNFDPKQTRATKWVMVDRCRKTGSPFTKSEYLHMFYKRQDNFAYKTAKDSDKLEHILWYLKKSVIGQLKIGSFCELLSLVGFSKQEIKRLVGDSSADERLKNLVLALTKKKKIDFPTLYSYEVDVDAFILFHLGAIDSKEYKNMLVGYFSPLRHTRYEIVEEKCCCKLSQSAFSLGEWRTILKDKVCLNIDVAKGYIASNLDKIAEIEDWNFAWHLWSANKLTESYDALLLYYEEIESHGHLVYFTENKNLPNDVKNLKGILPATFYKNLLDALKKFGNKQSVDQNDKFFNDNVEKLRKIILKAKDNIVE